MVTREFGFEISNHYFIAYLYGDHGLRAVWRALFTGPKKIKNAKKK